MLKLIPRNFNNIHHMILEWRREFLGHGFIILMLWLSAIGLISNGLVLLIRALALVGVVEIQ